jgi:hypothetical protein
MADRILASPEGILSTVKEEVQSLLKKLPDDCTYEDIQYHLYVIEKVHRGIQRAETEGTVSQGGSNLGPES